MNFITFLTLDLFLIDQNIFVFENV